jgi:hypothetical protein
MRHFSLETNTWSLYREISRRLWRQKIHCSEQDSQPLIHIRSQTNPFHNLARHLYQAARWLRRQVSGFSQRRPECNHRSAHVGFVVKEIVPGHFSPSTSALSVSVHRKIHGG